MNQLDLTYSFFDDDVINFIAELTYLFNNTWGRDKNSRVCHQFKCATAKIPDYILLQVEKKAEALEDKESLEYDMRHPLKMFSWLNKTEQTSIYDNIPLHVLNHVLWTLENGSTDEEVIKARKIAIAQLSNFSDIKTIKEALNALKSYKI